MHIKFYLPKREKENRELHTKFSDENYGEFYEVIRIDNFTNKSWEPRKEI